MRSTAIGFGAETTREDQIAIGDGASTFTLRGLSSAGSIKAQTVSTAMVTVDKYGNVATASRPDTGGIAVNAGDIAGSEAGAAARDAGIAKNVVCLGAAGAGPSTARVETERNADDIAVMDARLDSTRADVGGNATDLTTNGERIAERQEAGEAVAEEVAIVPDDMTQVRTHAAFNTGAVTETSGRVTALERASVGTDRRLGAVAANAADIERSGERVATTMAVGSLSLGSHENFAMSGGFGRYDGSSAFAMRIAPGAQLSAGLGVGAETGGVGGRIGIGFGW